MSGKIEPIIIPVGVWKMLDYDVIPRVVVKPVTRVRSSRQRCRIPIQTSARNRARRIVENLRPERGRW